MHIPYSDLCIFLQYLAVLPSRKRRPRQILPAIDGLEKRTLLSIILHAADVSGLCTTNDQNSTHSSNSFKFTEDQTADSISPIAAASSNTTTDPKHPNNSSAYSVSLSSSLTDSDSKSGNVAIATSNSASLTDTTEPPLARLSTTAGFSFIYHLWFQSKVAAQLTIHYDVFSSGAMYENEIVVSGVNGDHVISEGAGSYTIPILPGGGANIDVGVIGAITQSVVGTSTLDAHCDFSWDISSTDQTPLIAMDSVALSPDGQNVNANYGISGADLQTPGTIDFYWAKGPTINDKLGSPISIPTQTVVGSYTANTSLASLGPRPANGTFILAVADSPAADPSRNVSSVAVPMSPDVAVTDLRWVPLSDYTDASSHVRFDYKTNDYDGAITFKLFQSAASSAGPNDVRIATAIANVTPGKSGTIELQLSGPPNGQTKPNYLRVVAELASGTEANLTNNAAALRVSEPADLSIELQNDAPIANTRADRVELWLRRNRELIVSTAKKDGIVPEAIAGAIAWEALQNVKSDLQSRYLYGPGKVHPFEAEGESNAEAVERLKYVPSLTLLNRIKKLRTADGAISYIGAIMGAFADIADAAGSKANLRQHAEILTSFYNGVSPEVLGGRPLRISNAAEYFQKKIALGDTYDPNPTMGTWVKQHYAYLRRSLML